MKNNQSIKFHKYYPGGNPTILVENFDGRIAREKYGVLAAKLMKDAYVGAEQVGYLEMPRHSRAAGRLHMMGGELCLNALRCFAHYISEREGRQSFSVETSGAEFLVTLEAKNDEMTVCLPNDLRPCPLSNDLFLVRLPGIIHFVVLCHKFPSKRAAKSTFEDIRRRHHNDIKDQQAVGIIFLRWNVRCPSILPIIHVTGSSTMVTETSCGSGSMAAFVIMNKINGCRESLIMQPSGIPLQLEIGKNTLSLQGTVQKTVSGEIYTAV